MTPTTSLYKSWKLLGLHPLCALFYTAGYALREYGVYNYLYSFENLIIFILSQVLIYICPYVVTQTRPTPLTAD